MIADRNADPFTPLSEPETRGMLEVRDLQMTRGFQGFYSGHVGIACFLGTVVQLSSCVCSSCRSAPPTNSLSATLSTDFVVVELRKMRFFLKKLSRGPWFLHFLGSFYWGLLSPLFEAMYPNLENLARVS